MLGHFKYRSSVAERRLLSFLTTRAVLPLFVVVIFFPGSFLFTEPGDKTPDSSEAQSVEEDTEKAFEEEKQKSDETAKQNEARSPSSSLFSYVDSQGRSYALDLMAAVDLVGGWDKDTPHSTENSAIVREAEVGMFAAIDQLAQGTLLMAAHNEGGEMKFELHEAYLFFPTTFLPSTNIKAGQFFYDVGRLNSIHRHDWAFTNAPIVHEQLLSEEAAGDTGIETKTLMPWKSFWQELSLGVFNGKTFGHAHTEGPNKQNPLFTAHLKQFIDFGGGWGTQFGFSYLRWNPDSNPHRTTQQSGFDWIVKWKKGKLGSFQALTEVWYRETRQTREHPFDPPAPPVDTRVGAYTFLEYQLAEQWFAGIRFDGFTNPNQRGRQGYTEPNGTSQESAMLTYRPSEFSYFRATAARTTDIETGKKTFQFYLQGTFIIGKHPAHIY